jgi:plastocyanin
MMNKNIIIGIIILLILIGGYFLFFKSAPQPAPSVSQPSNQQQSSQSSPIQTPAEEEEEYVVIYNDAGYSPKTLTIKKGETVTFKNQSSRSMWPASAMHPSHRVYSGTSLEEHCPDLSGTAFDACKGYLPGESWSFKFDKVGTWKYHDHLTPSDTGTIVVE